MWPFSSKVAVKKVRRRPGIDFSLTGLVYCCVMMLLGLAAINHNINLLFGIFGLLFGILLVAWGLSRLMLTKVVVYRTLPDHAVVGVPVRVEYHFQNNKLFFPSLAVSVYELDGADCFRTQPGAYLVHTAGRSSATSQAEFMPSRRGIVRFDRMQLATSFPFGFVRRAVSARQSDKLLVYPAIGQVDRAVLQWCRAAEHSGATVRPRQGGQDEFYGVKEHRAGDNPRHIYWKRSAITVETSGTLIAREMTQVAPPRLMLLVDTWLTDNTPEAVARVERAVAMAASLAARALEEDLSVGMLAWAGNGWQRIDPSRGKRHRSDLLAAMARLPLNVTQDSSQLTDQAVRTLRNGTTGILFTAQKLQAGIDSSNRGAMAVLPVDSDEAKQWFRFDASIDFSEAGPLSENV